MRRKKPGTLRRILESIVIILLSSCPIYVLVKGGVIPNTPGGYIGSFGISMLLFLLLSYKVLYAHFWAVHFKTAKYLAVNLSIFGVTAALGFLCLAYFPRDVYTAFFGYTKPFRQLFGMTDITSAALFWVLYLLLILFVIIRVLYFDSNYKHRCMTKPKKGLEKFKI